MCKNAYVGARISSPFIPAFSCVDIIFFNE